MCDIVRIGGGYWIGNLQHGLSFHMEDSFGFDCGIEMRYKDRYESPRI